MSPFTNVLNQNQTTIKERERKSEKDFEDKGKLTYIVLVTGDADGICYLVVNEVSKIHDAKLMSSE